MADMGFGYSSWVDWEQFTDAQLAVLAQLPHGSGIDAEWTAELLKNGKVQAFNSYHAMDEYGGYRFWFDFSVTFDARCPDLFRIQFHGKDSHNRLRTSYGLGLRDYLEDTIYHAIES